MTASDARELDNMRHRMDEDQSNSVNRSEFLRLMAYVTIVEVCPTLRGAIQLTHLFIIVVL